MGKPFDVSLKDLIADYPGDWLAFLGGFSWACAMRRRWRTNFFRRCKPWKNP